MNAAVISRPNYTPALEGSLKGPLIKSGFAHLLLFVVAAVGLPFMASEPPPIMMPVSVEFVAEPAEKAAAPKIDPNPLQKPEPPKEVVEPPKPEPPKPLPEPEPEPEPEVVEPVKEEVELPPPPPKPKEKPKPKPKPKPKSKPKPKPKEKSFDQLLKDITPDKPTETSQNEADAKANENVRSAVPDFSQTLTRGELDALNSGIGRCWRVDGGKRYAENLLPKLRVYVDAAMNVSRVEYLEPIRVSTDPAYRAMAESARRALLNPVCRQLNVSPQKYKGKYFDLTFDPRKMLGY